MSISNPGGTGSKLGVVQIKSEVARAGAVGSRQGSPVKNQAVGSTSEVHNIDKPIEDRQGSPAKNQALGSTSEVLNNSAIHIHNIEKPIEEWVIKLGLSGRTNSMIRHRGYSDYKLIFGLKSGAADFFNELRKDGPVRILDSGCGKGCCVEDLKKEKDDYDEVIGFDEMSDPPMTANNFFQINNKEFDVIFDLHGSIAYSRSDSMRILKNSIAALRKDGVLYLTEPSNPNRANYYNNKGSELEMYEYWTKLAGEGHFVCTQSGILSFKTWLSKKIQESKISGINVDFLKNGAGQENKFLIVTRISKDLNLSPLDNLKFIRERYTCPPLVYWQEEW